MSRTDNDDGVAADDGCSAPEERVVAVQNSALPRELVLLSVLAADYSTIDLTTTWIEQNFHFMNFLILFLLPVVFLSC